MRRALEDRRHFAWGACLGLLVLLSGCASRGSVKHLQAELASLQTTVEAASRNLTQTISLVTEWETRFGEHLRRLEALGQRIEPLETRLAEFERTIKEVQGAVEALTAQVARPTVRAPAEGAEGLYASAQAHYQSRNLGQAVLEFTELIQSFPKHPLAENAQYWIAAAYLAHRDYRQALIEFTNVLDRYPGGRKAPDALYQLGVCYRNLYEPRRAREAWERLIREFPGSDAARMAEKSLLRGSASVRAK
ncbi:MAG: tol-pal system protein YbgF [Candidatus Rokubacteria bacterium]|nr:tol-pal system protein YbgF [Candidatus Rokubacteria bacterium]